MAFTLYVISYHILTWSFALAHETKQKEAIFHGKKTNKMDFSVCVKSRQMLLTDLKKNGGNLKRVKLDMPQMCACFMGQWEQCSRSLKDLWVISTEHWPVVLWRVGWEFRNGESVKPRRIDLAHETQRLANSVGPSGKKRAESTNYMWTFIKWLCLKKKKKK